MNPDSSPSSPSPEIRFAPLLGDVLFLFGCVFLSVAFLTLLRGLLLWSNIELAEGIPLEDFAHTFVLGARFDLIVTCILTVPLVLALLLPRGLGSRKIALLWLGLTGSLTIFAGVTELEFYREFHIRLNSIAFHYLQEDTATVVSMIWNGYPVVTYLLMWLFMTGIYLAALLWLDRSTLKQTASRYRMGVRVPVFVLLLVLVVLGARGTWRSGPPLRWGDAFHSEHLFANHLGLNGAYTLAKAAIAEGDEKLDKAWLNTLPEEFALSVTREMLLTPADELIAPDQYPLLRRHTPQIRLPTAPKNIVLIMMESFSGAFTGALSHDQGITPEFDKLAAQGLLFDHFFSNGTHTHQGMFASVACFPNLPGHEYLMQQPQGQHHFSGLPALLKPLGFNDIYVYNGHFAWDNQEGFFRNQGMTHFVGRDSYVNPVFMDPTWGVSDEDMFNRSLAELNKLPEATPFFAILQTLSNHTPYALPKKLAFEPVSGFGRLDEHLTAQRYSDWALGQFFDKAALEPWFDQTLFVIVGDHGFGVDRQLSEIDLLRFHVPLLLLGAGIQSTYGDRLHTIGTQVDIVPTVVSLLGKPFTHQCWGRDLLALPEGDPGFGIIKPSGSDQTVALIRGNTITTKTPGGEPRRGKYTLYPEESYVADKTIGNAKATTIQLDAYIQTALNALLQDRTGI